MAYKLIKNKRGDVSITLLVLGIFAVCTLAIVSFLLNGRPDQGNFANTEIFENLSSQVDSFYLYINSGLSPEEASKKIGGQIEGNKLILNIKQEAQAPFSFITREEPKAVLSIKYAVDLSK